MKLYGAFTKTENQDDGTIIVTGIASSEVVDAQGDVVTADAMKAAIPDYMKFGAVREMHDAKKAAGTALEIVVGEDGVTTFQAHIVDPIAVKKVQSSVYKGFSIGGSITKRNELNKNQIDNMRLTEISLVDRPANPHAVLLCYKADSAEDVAQQELEVADPDDQVPADIVDTTVADEVAHMEAAADEPIELAEVPVVEVPAEVLITADIDGVTQKLRKADDGRYEIVEDLAKGSYSISTLARLSEDLEYFACARSYDVNSESSPIPDAARKLAGQLYDMLLTLVSEDVTTAKQRLKDAKASKADDVEDLQKALTVATTPDPLLGEFIKVYGDNESQPLVEVIAKVVSQNLALEKRNKELEAMPAPAKANLRAVGKGEDVAKADSPVSDVPATPLDLVKQVHRSGGQVIR